jgi:hypothetical protein
MSIRSLIEKQLNQTKSSDPHAVLSTIMNNTSNIGKQELKNDSQRLRLDVWDTVGSTSFSDITHQVRIRTIDTNVHIDIVRRLRLRYFYRRERSICSYSI